MRSRGVLMSKLAVLVRGGRMLLRLVMIARVVVMSSGMMVMGSGMMVRGRLGMMVARGMLRCGCHDDSSSRYGAVLIRCV